MVYSTLYFSFFGYIPCHIACGMMARAADIIPCYIPAGVLYSMLYSRPPPLNIPLAGIYIYMACYIANPFRPRMDRGGPIRSLERGPSYLLLTKRPFRPRMDRGGPIRRGVTKGVAA